MSQKRDLSREYSSQGRMSRKRPATAVTTEGLATASQEEPEEMMFNDSQRTELMEDFNHKRVQDLEQQNLMQKQQLEKYRLEVRLNDVSWGLFDGLRRLHHAIIEAPKSCEDTTGLPRACCLCYDVIHSAILDSSYQQDRTAWIEEKNNRLVKELIESRGTQSTDVELLQSCSQAIHESIWTLTNIQAKLPMLHWEFDFRDGTSPAHDARKFFFAPDTSYVVCVPGFVQGYGNKCQEVTHPRVCFDTT